jgi:uncharacterized membrane protein YkoI
MRYLTAALTIVFALATCLATGSAVLAADKKTEREEQQISMDQVPAAVKATLEREAKGGTLGSVMQETEKGKTFYEAEIDKNGKKSYVHVAPDGKVLKHERTRREAKEESKDMKK